MMTVNQTAPMHERLLTPDELAELVPSRRKGRKTSAQTIRRWMFEGLKGKFLRYTRVGSIPCSSQSALDEFFDELTRDDENRRFHHVDEIATNKPMPAKKADQRLEHFKKQAEKLGL